MYSPGDGSKYISELMLKSAGCRSILIKHKRIETEPLQLRKRIFRCRHYT